MLKPSRALFVGSPVNWNMLRATYYCGDCPYIPGVSPREPWVSPNSFNAELLGTIAPCDDKSAVQIKKTPSVQTPKVYSRLQLSRKGGQTLLFRSWLTNPLCFTYPWVQQSLQQEDGRCPSQTAASEPSSHCQTHEVTVKENMSATVSILATFCLATHTAMWTHTQRFWFAKWVVWQITVQCGEDIWICKLMKCFWLRDINYTKGAIVLHPGIQC